MTSEDNSATWPLLPRVTQETYLSALHHDAASSRCARLDILGHTLEGDPLCRLRVSNFDVPDDEKFHIVVAGLHVGGEHAALHAMLHTIEYLLSAGAAHYRNRYVVSFLPCLNPYGCFCKDIDQYHTNSRGVDPYTAGRGDCFDLETLTLKRPEDAPEIAAFCQAIDEERPEVLLDWHGASRRFAGEMMRSTVGASLSNHLLMPWATRLLQAMRAEICKGNAAVFDLEEYFQRIPAGPEFKAKFPGRFRPSREWFFTDHYAYAKYHTLPIVFEIGCEEIGAMGLKGLLDFGLNLPPEAAGSLPVDHAYTEFGNLTVAAYGCVPGEKRRSRTELWAAAPWMRTRLLNPVCVGRIGVALTLGISGERRLRNAGDSWGQDSQTLFRDLSSTPDFDFDAMRMFLAQGPEQRFSVVCDLPDLNSDPIHLPQHGLVLSSYIPVGPSRNVYVEEVRLNGFPLQENSRDGYELIRGTDGYHLRTNVPPDLSRRLDLYVVTVHYSTDAKLQCGWTPSAAMLSGDITSPVEILE